MHLTQVGFVVLWPTCFNSTMQYSIGYKTEFFSFQNNPKNLDPSCETDLDLWDCLGKVKLIAKFHRTD